MDDKEIVTRLHVVSRFFIITAAFIVILDGATFLAGERDLRLLAFIPISSAILFGLGMLTRRWKKMMLMGSVSQEKREGIICFVSQIGF